MIKTRQQVIQWFRAHLQHHLQHMSNDAEPRTMIQVDPAELTQVLSVLSNEQFSRGDIHEHDN